MQLLRYRAQRPRRCFLRGVPPSTKTVCFRARFTMAWPTATKASPTIVSGQRLRDPVVASVTPSTWLLGVEVGLGPRVVVGTLMVVAPKTLVDGTSIDEVGTEVTEVAGGR